MKHSQSLRQYARMIGIGGHLPEKKVTNESLSDFVDTSHEWIVSRTGIEARHIAAEGELASDLALPAAKKALQSASMEIDDIDMIIFATTTPDRIYPSTACLLQAKLGGKNSAAFDVQAVCSGFLYALGIANAMIISRSANRILVVGSEVYSHILDWNDRGTCVLFGDGAGAAVLSASSVPGIEAIQLHADGRYANHLTVNAHVKNGQLEGDGYTRMDGSTVYRFAVDKMTKSLLSVLDGKKPDWLVLHQANKRIIDAVRKRLDIPEEKTLTTVAEHGNTSAASIPLALAVNESKFQSGESIAIAAVGGGFTWGAAHLTW